MSTILSLGARPFLRLLWPALQVTAVGGAAFFAYRGFARYHQSQANFDEAVLWLGLSLLCLAVVAWDGRLPRPTFAWRRALALAREHWWEVAALSAVVGFGAFLRLYTFGDFPPSGVIFGEEGINGRIAYQILHGDRPLEYPLTRYVSALGFLLFGENTTGLRLPFVLAGILTIPPFYLLARELVRPPAALFATALLAAAVLLVEPTLEMQARTLAMMLFFYFFVRGIRTQSALLLGGAGFLGGLLSYEWEAFKLVPLVAVGFLGALAVKGLAWRWPGSLLALFHRTGQMIRSRWRSALAFFGSAAVVATPLAVAELRGEGIYLNAIDRHTAGAYEASPGLFAAHWLEQLKWAAELFLPFGPRTFPNSPLSSGVPLVDLVTGTLLISSVLVAVATFQKPYRALFLGYFLIGMAGTALVAEPFWGWRFIPLLPVGLLLVAFLVDDVAATAHRLAPRAAAYAVPALLFGAAVYASVSNAQTLLGTIVHDPELPRVYSGDRPERGYVLCDYLRGRGKDNFSYILYNEQFVGAFSGPTDTVADQVQAFRELAWVCGGLRGIAVAAPQEAWPLHPAPVGRATLAFITVPEAVDEVAAALRQALPAKPRPDRVIEKPATGGPFALVGYELSPNDVRALHGLHARYEAAAGRLLAERVDDVAALRWGGDSTPALPFTVRWRGVVFLDRPQSASLVAVTGDPTEVRVDGRVSFSSLAGMPVSLPQALLPGWHPLEVTVVKRAAGGAFSLRWADEQGRTIRALAAEDLFPLSSLRGWRHRRTLASEGEALDTPVTERFDFQPYLALHWLARVRAVVTDAPPVPNVQQVRVVREEWSALWHVPAEREYRLEAKTGSGALGVTLDGAPAIQLPPQEGAERTAEVRLRVPRGEHRIEVVQIPDGGLWTGATLTISDPGDPTFTPELSPF